MAWPCAPRRIYCEHMVHLHECILIWRKLDTNGDLDVFQRCFVASCDVPYRCPPFAHILATCACLCMVGIHNLVDI